MQETVSLFRYTLFRLSHRKEHSLIVALAGRRIDPPEAPALRFPAANIGVVTARIRDLFVVRGATALVCAAACGADLLALGVAGEIGLRRRVVLPFPREVFRIKSVVDRPGDWGERYDRTLDQLEPSGDVVIADPKPNDSGAIREATEILLDESLALGSRTKQPVLAVAVWDLKPRGPDDWTAHFLRRAAQRGVETVEVSTL